MGKDAEGKTFAVKSFQSGNSVAFRLPKALVIEDWTV